MDRAQRFHFVTFSVALAAVALQFALVLSGHAVLDETDPPDVGTRVIRFFSYLTIWSNLLVLGSALTLALGRDDGGRLWRTLRLSAVVLIALVAVVHFLLLRPILDLEGADLVADRLLHMVVPVFAVVGWLVFGPRGRASAAELLPFLALPVTWLAYTLIRGAIVDWYPYPFIDVIEHGYGVVVLNCVGIAAVMLAFAVGALWIDRKLSARSRPGA